MQERRLGTQSANKSEEVGKKHQEAECLAINAAAGDPRFTKVASLSSLLLSFLQFMSGPRLHKMEPLIVENVEFQFKCNTLGSTHPLAPAVQTPPFEKFPDMQTPKTWRALLNPSPKPVLPIQSCRAAAF